MAPKLSPVQIDEKLERLHESVCDHVGLLASRNGASLRACLRQTASAEESRWYQFLCKNANAFSESQNDRVRRAYALLEEHWSSVAPRAAVLPELVATQGEKPLADQGQATVLTEPVETQGQKPLADPGQATVPAELVADHGDDGVARQGNTD